VERWDELTLESKSGFPLSIYGAYAPLTATIDSWAAGLNEVLFLFLLLLCLSCLSSRLFHNLVAYVSADPVRACHRELLIMLKQFFLFVYFLFVTPRLQSIRHFFMVAWRCGILNRLYKYGHIPLKIL
jgi:hypothetical protein